VGAVNDIISNLKTIAPRYAIIGIWPLTFWNGCDIRLVVCNSEGMMFRKINGREVPPQNITITIDGQEEQAEAGEPLAAILLRRPPFTTRNTPVSGAARAPYCMMGSCFECLVRVDGVTSTRSCMTPVREGMEVCLQHERPDPLKDIRP
jgi:hypothetical protein